MRLLATENKLETLTRKVEENGSGNRDILARVNDVSRKQDTLQQQLSDMRQTMRCTTSCVSVII